MKCYGDGSFYQSSTYIFTSCYFKVFRTEAGLSSYDSHCESVSNTTDKVGISQPGREFRVVLTLNSEY